MVLGFGRRAERINGRGVRASRFEPRSMLPVAAACVVANSVRETLGTILSTPVALRLLEPTLPDPAAWACIAAGAQIFAVRGRVADGAFVLRRDDALALAGAAFGETGGASRDLSAIEERMLTRTIAALCGSLAPICGAREDSRIARLGDLSGYVTYFELLLEQPVEARIGIAMSREPQAEATGMLNAADLADIEIDLALEIAHGSIDAARVLELRPGDELRLDTKLGESAQLRWRSTVIARGECGALDGRVAMVLR